MPRKKTEAPESESSTALVPVENGAAGDSHQQLVDLADRLTGDAPADQPPDPNPPIDAEFTVKRDTGSDEQLHRICNEEKECSRLEKIWEEKKEDAKEAKDDFDEAVQRLRHLIQSASKDDESMPLFNGNGHARPTTTDAEVEDESWKKVPLSEALEGISDTVLEKLRDAELETVGDLQAFIERVGQNGYSDPLSTIKGIGEATAKKIAESLERFWSRRRGQ